jgi:hypothetical protein
MVRWTEADRVDFASAGDSTVHAFGVPPPELAVAPEPAELAALGVPLLPQPANTTADEPATASTRTSIRVRAMTRLSSCCETPITLMQTS